jgi:NAD(P)-dependent dehydrogenase (short-subunit alcohol dehydrogenase family)
MILLIIFTCLLNFLYSIYRYFFPSPNIDPKGKYVLISGCDSGFGHALAIKLDQQGFNVFAGVFNSNNETLLRNTLSKQATIFCLDITKQEDIDKAYDLVKEKTNTLHALVNNAGISTSGYIDWMTMESMRKIMDVNFFGHVAMTKKFLPLLIPKRYSRVVNICSVAGIVTVPMKSAYSASKYALESFSDCLRREMTPWGLYVSIIEPGPMRTPIIEGHDQIINEVWNKLSIDVQERWGENFLKIQTKNLINSFVYRHAENPDKVVEVLEHAVKNSKPEIRYQPGWQSKFFFFPLSILPDWLTDFILIQTTNSDVKPAGLQKQHIE